MVLVERSLMVVIAWAIISFMPLIWIPKPPLIGAAGIIFVAGIAAYFRARSEMQYYLKGRFTRPIRRALSLSATFLAALIATAAYLWTPSNSIGVREVVPQNYFEKVLVLVAPLIQVGFPEFSADKTFESYVRESIRDNSLTEEQKEVVIQNARDRYRTEYGLEIDPDDKLSYVLYLSFTDLAERQLGRYENFFPVALAVGLFAALRLVMWPLYWAALGLLLLILRLLLRFNVIELRKVPTELILYELV